MTIKEFYKSQILYDQSFLDELLHKYKDDLKLIWDKFSTTDDRYIKLRVLEVRNEVLDFLDGNGFIVREDKGNITIEKNNFAKGGVVNVEDILNTISDTVIISSTPSVSTTITPTYVSSLYGSITIPPSSTQSGSSITTTTSPSVETYTYDPSMIGSITYAGNMPDDIITAPIGNIYSDNAGKLWITTKEGPIQLS